MNDWYYLLSFVLFLQYDHVITDETQAVLTLDINHVIQNDHIKPGEPIAYSCNLTHAPTSKLRAVNLTILLFMSRDIKYNGLTNQVDYLTNETLPNGNILFKYPLLEPRSNMLFEFSVTLIQPLEVGQHHIVTPFEISYQSILITEVTTSTFSKLLFTHHVTVYGEGCNEGLGMSNNGIKDYQLTASTSQVDLKPYQARFNNLGDAWCATKENKYQFIQVALAYKARITAISTWGRKHKASWVKEYILMYSDDGETWIEYSDNGLPKLFVGNTDQSTEVKHYLNHVTANFIRIRPLDWLVGVCLRFEIYGCTLNNKRNCIDPLGMEDGRIPIESLSHSVTNNPDSKVENVRLNKKVTSYPFGWMADSGKDDWLQIDLGSNHQVTLIAVQGGYGTRVSSFYVTSFYIQYSNNSLDWNKIMEGENEKLFQGPSSLYEAAKPLLINLPPTVKGRYFRVIPDQYIAFKIMRLEIYGCMIEEDYTYKTISYLDSPVEISRRNVLVDEVRSVIYLCSLTSERERSSCKRSKDGFTWDALSPIITAIISLRSDTGRLFAVDRNMNIAISDNSGDSWYSISSKEWRYETESSHISNFTNIQNVLPTKVPTDNLSWSLANGTVWGVSGVGLHTKASPNVTTWKLSAMWKCCGL